MLQVRLSSVFVPGAIYSLLVACISFSSFMNWACFCAPDGLSPRRFRLGSFLTIKEVRHTASSEKCQAPSMLKRMKRASKMVLVLSEWDIGIDLTHLIHPL